jgi:hypothetical protein
MKFLNGLNYIFQFTLETKSIHWFQNGKNSLRIRQTNGQEFIFTFNSHKDWKFETIDMFYQDKTKGGKS